MNKEKRSRAKNFSDMEKLLIVEFVKKNSSILENKGNDPRVHLKKKLLWLELQKKLHATGCIRTVPAIKELYQRLKVQAKTVICNFKKYSSGTGGGPKSKDPSDLDWAIYDICPEDFKMDESSFDSDAQHEKTQPEVSEVFSSNYASSINLPSETPIIIQPVVPINEVTEQEIVPPVPSIIPSVSTPQPEINVVLEKKNKKRKREISTYEEELLKLHRAVLEQRLKNENEEHMEQMEILKLKKQKLIKKIELIELKKQNTYKN